MEGSARLEKIGHYTENGINVTITRREVGKEPGAILPALDLEYQKKERNDGRQTHSLALVVLGPAGQTADAMLGITHETKKAVDALADVATELPPLEVDKAILISSPVSIDSPELIRNPDMRAQALAQQTMEWIIEKRKSDPNMNNILLFGSSLGGKDAQVVGPLLQELLNQAELAIRVDLLLYQPGGMYKQNIVEVLRAASQVSDLVPKTEELFPSGISGAKLATEEALAMAKGEAGEAILLSRARERLSEQFDFAAAALLTPETATGVRVVDREIKNWIKENLSLQRAWRELSATTDKRDQEILLEQIRVQLARIDLREMVERRNEFLRPVVERENQGLDRRVHSRKAGLKKGVNFMLAVLGQGVFDRLPLEKRKKIKGRVAVFASDADPFFPNWKAADLRRAQMEEGVNHFPKAEKVYRALFRGPHGVSDLFTGTRQSAAMIADIIYRMAYDQDKVKRIETRRYDLGKAPIV